MQPLGKNFNGYGGETIDITSILSDIQRIAAAKGWERDYIPLDSDNAPRPIDFVAYRRAAAKPRKSFYISSGIHGDEPAGPLAARQLFEEDRWPDDLSLWICPCLNPTGFMLNRRENFRSIDLNRDYRHLQSQEIRAHLNWLKNQPKFDLTVCLHEDWESKGFYVYETNPDKLPSHAEKIVEAVATVCPIEMADSVDGWPAANGIIRPNVKPEEREQWPEALYLVMNKTRHGYTFESPSDFPLETRVTALVTGVRAVLALL